ncbi:MAG: hypothetical protein FJ194_16850 [Gammaproteobacteria bacterium]|nr:hypothetical protein [Gammaproteobacteria bacterium]
MNVQTQSAPNPSPHSTAAAGPVAETAAPPAPPSLKRGDDTLTPAESLLLISALCTLIGVVLITILG